MGGGWLEAKEEKERRKKKALLTGETNRREETTSGRGTHSTNQLLFLSSLSPISKSASPKPLMWYFCDKVIFTFSFSPSVRRLFYFEWLIQQLSVLWKGQMPPWQFKWPPLAVHNPCLTRKYHWYLTRQLNSSWMKVRRIGECEGWDSLVRFKDRKERESFVMENRHGMNFIIMDLLLRGEYNWGGGNGLLDNYAGGNQPWKEHWFQNRQPGS